MTYVKNTKSSFFSPNQIAEAYGQTECSAGCTVTMPGDWKAGRFLKFSCEDRLELRKLFWKYMSYGGFQMRVRR